MGIKNLHTTINYKELIERQANAKVERTKPAKINKQNQTKINNASKIYRKSTKNK